MGSESRAHRQSLAGSRSEPKNLVGQKRGIGEVEEVPESLHKRVKMRDLESVFRSEREGVNTAHHEFNTDSRAVDLNVNADISNAIGCDKACSEESRKHLSSQKEEQGKNDGHTQSRGFDLDLNATDIANADDPFYPYKNYGNMKSRDDFECGSSVGPLDEKDPMRVWKGLKQNNYMSSSCGFTRMPTPKSRSRKKTKNDFAKKIELAKKEQVNKFARVAAPSGLLNGLNPGIINHVRNSKQVHSIIEALVRSTRSENQHSGNKKDNLTPELNERFEFHGVPGPGLTHGDVSQGRRHMREDYLMTESISAKTEFEQASNDSHDREARDFFRMSGPHLMENENDAFAPKLSSSVTAASDFSGCLSNEQSTNLTSVNSLTIKAANVASQWLELLHLDIRGRISALRRSRKRVQAVITTELPHLTLREFPSHLEKSAVDEHTLRWRNIFELMDKTLSEEESKLESWGNQIKEMQLHCENGNTSRLEVDNSEKELAVRAAAASLYSTCGFLFSKENPPFC